MCGINGIISKDENKDKLIKSMNENGKRVNPTINTVMKLARALEWSR